MTNIKNKIAAALIATSTVATAQTAHAFINPQSLWEVVVPVCWGAPQDCRKPKSGGTIQQRIPVTQPAPQQQFAAFVAVDCFDPQGNYRGDSVFRYVSNISFQDARNGAWNYANAQYWQACHSIDRTFTPRGKPYFK